MSGDARHDFRGPNSDLVKFSQTLCKRCNDTRSQPFDNAWDTFVIYLADHEEEVVDQRQMDWATVFGPDWQARSANVERYILKHAMCRVVDELPGPLTVGGEYIDFLNGGPRPPMAIDLALDLGIVGMLRATRANPPPEQPEAADAGFLGTTSLLTLASQSDPEQWAEPHAALYYRYMAVFWWLGPSRTTTPFDRQVIALGTTDAMFGQDFGAIFGTGRRAARRRLWLRLRHRIRQATARM